MKTPPIVSAEEWEAARDELLVVFVSRAPQADIERWRTRMGWEIPWFTREEEARHDIRGSSDAAEKAPPWGSEGVEKAPPWYAQFDARD